MSRRDLPDAPPVTLDVVPVRLREHDPEVERALDCAAGRDPRWSIDAGCTGLAAALLLVVFVVVALVR